MDEFARLPSAERQTYFEQTAAQMGLNAAIVEKDFWVCWSLKGLFELPEFGSHLTFKGGTSLSKVYGVIKRFSEDVDIAIERSYLGFGGDQEPEAGKSGKKKKKRVEALREACQAAITARLEPELRSNFSDRLSGDQRWSLSFADNDPDQQTLVFTFPRDEAQTAHEYVAPIVRIELGARSDHFPVETREVQSYVAEEYPEAINEKTARVRVLGAERTYWEKATILHAIYHTPEDRQIKQFLSRHYYDLMMLDQSETGPIALSRFDLLERVADHKSVFFASARATYGEARPGTLRLVPPEHRHAELHADYEGMQSMFFDEVPGFDEILEYLAGLEARINGGLPASVQNLDRS